MSPREKQLALLSFVGIVIVALYCILTFIYATLLLAGFCVAFCYHGGEPLPARLGLNPRAGLNAPGALRRWLLGWGVIGVPVAARGRARTGVDGAEHREAEGRRRQRQGDVGIYRGDALARDSFLFSPRDFLMGSYIGRPVSPPAEYGRPRSARNPHELLRETLARPNHAVYTPSRRLSFAREPLGTVGRFTITPKRHYPLQQTGVPSVGVLPPVRWDGFQKKNILSAQNSPAAMSPVRVKIAQPNHSTPSVDHVRYPRLKGAPADPCSRESVLRVLKESRKREVEEEDMSLTIEQRSKRRRNDSGGSSHSAFDHVLPNGTPSQLVPKPGTLKRGMASLAEDSIMKRSRTSSISSGSGLHAPRGTPGTGRNVISSSYSSSLGLSQWKQRSKPSSPLSSPGSSRCQTPERASKRLREDEGQSPSSASSVRSDKAASCKAPVTSQSTPVPSVPVVSTSDSPDSGGKIKRRITLLCCHSDDQIFLPPLSPLGYSVTAKDLDDEKKAAIRKIQKFLETPAPEPERPVSPPAITSTISYASSTATATTLNSLLADPLPTASSLDIPVINLDPSPSRSRSSSSSSVCTASAPSDAVLLEALKMKTSAPVCSTSAASTATVSAPTTPEQPSGFSMKATTAGVSPQPPPGSQALSSATGGEQPSAFTQVLGQVFKSSGSAAPVTGAGLFGLASPNSIMSVSTASTPVTASTAPTSSSESSVTMNPLLASGFKPIFSIPTTTMAPTATSLPEAKPAVPNFKPIFGAATAIADFGQPASLATTNPSSTIPSTSTSSIFGASASSTTAVSSDFPGLTNTPTGTASTMSSTNSMQPAAQPAAKSVFGNWSTPSTTSTISSAGRAPSSGSTFQFGAATTTTTTAAAPAPAAATTTTSNSNFAFGATKPDPQAANQEVISFGQPASSQNSTTASFGGFAMANSAATTAPAATQPTFAFGKPSFEAPAAQSTFGSPAAQPKPFPFGSGVVSAAPAPASSPAPAAFNFGAAAATTATTFGTPAKPAFGANSTGFPFGSAAASPAAPSAAAVFGAATETQSSSPATFAFSSGAPQPAPAGPSQPATGGFNFGASMPCPQFGTPVSNNPSPQIGGFNFGAAAADKPAFGTSSPSFGQGASAGPIPFGSPGAPVQGFNSVPFGSPATPSFSIGAGSKPSGARQRLQARRQHNRKK